MTTNCRSTLRHSCSFRYSFCVSLMTRSGGRAVIGCRAANHADAVGRNVRCSVSTVIAKSHWPIASTCHEHLSNGVDATSTSVEFDGTLRRGPRQVKSTFRSTSESLDVRSLHAWVYSSKNSRPVVRSLPPSAQFWNELGGKIVGKLQFGNKCVLFSDCHVLICV